MGEEHPDNIDGASEQPETPPEWGSLDTGVSGEIPQWMSGEGSPELQGVKKAIADLEQYVLFPENLPRDDATLKKFSFIVGNEKSPGLVDTLKRELTSKVNEHNEVIQLTPDYIDKLKGIAMDIAQASLKQIKGEGDAASLASYRDAFEIRLKRLKHVHRVYEQLKSQQISLDGLARFSPVDDEMADRLSAFLKTQLEEGSYAYRQAVGDQLGKYAGEHIKFYQDMLARGELGAGKKSEQELRSRVLMEIRKDPPRMKKSAEYVRALYEWANYIDGSTALTKLSMSLGTKFRAIKEQVRALDSALPELASNMQDPDDDDVTSESSVKFQRQQISYIARITEKLRDYISGTSLDSLLNAPGGVNVPSKTLPTDAVTRVHISEILNSSTMATAGTTIDKRAALHKLVDKLVSITDKETRDGIIKADSKTWISESFVELEAKRAEYRGDSPVVRPSFDIDWGISVDKLTDAINSVASNPSQESFMKAHALVDNLYLSIDAYSLALDVKQIYEIAKGLQSASDAESDSLRARVGTRVEYLYDSLNSSAALLKEDASRDIDSAKKLFASNLAALSKRESPPEEKQKLFDRVNTMLMGLLEQHKAYSILADRQRQIDELTKIATKNYNLVTDFKQTLEHPLVRNVFSSTIRSAFINQRKRLNAKEGRPDADDDILRQNAWDDWNNGSHILEYSLEFFMTYVDEFRIKTRKLEPAIDSLEDIGREAIRLYDVVSTLAKGMHIDIGEVESPGIMDQVIRQNPQQAAISLASKYDKSGTIGYVFKFAQQAAGNPAGSTWTLEEFCSDLDAVLRSLSDLVPKVVEHIKDGRYDRFKTDEEFLSHIIQ